MIKHTTEFLATMAVISYFTGWVYLYYYLNYFGFSIFEVEVPFHYFFVYSFPILAPPIHFSIPWIGLMILVVILYFVVRLYLLNKYTVFFTRASSCISKQLFLIKLDMKIAGYLGCLIVFVIILTTLHDRSEQGAEKAAQMKTVESGVHILLKSNALNTIKSQYSGKRKLRQIQEFFKQTTDADVNQQRVILVFADKKFYFLILKSAEMDSFVSVAIPRTEVVLLGKIF